jgi:hypothetical protein
MSSQESRTSERHIIQIVFTGARSRQQLCNRLSFKLARVKVVEGQVVHDKENGAAGWS